MRKIVILTDQAGEDNTLIRCLLILFPECEIRVKSERTHNHNYSGFAEFFVKEGTDSISLNRDSVMKITLKVNEMEERLW